MKYRKCEICHIRSERRDGKKRIFMAKFPSDEDRCRQWVKLTGIEDLAYIPIEKLHSSKYLCGNHFKETDFKKKKTQLRKSAVPSIGLTYAPLSEEILSGFPCHMYSDASASKIVPLSPNDVCAESSGLRPSQEEFPQNDHDYYTSNTSTNLNILNRLEEEWLLSDEDQTQDYGAVTYNTVAEELPKSTQEVQFPWEQDSAVVPCNNDSTVAEEVELPVLTQAVQFPWEQDSAVVPCDGVGAVAEELPLLTQEIQFPWEQDNAVVPCDDSTDRCVSTVEDAPPPVEGLEPPPSEAEEEPLLDLTDYQCHFCSMTIIGFRYTCVQCLDVDLCGACEVRQEHATHYVLRIPGPRPLAEVAARLRTVRRALLAEALVDMPADLRAPTETEDELDYTDPMDVEPVEAGALNTDDEDAAMTEPLPEPEGSGDECGEPTTPPHHQAAIHGRKSPADELHADDADAAMDGLPPEPEESGCNEESGAPESPTLPAQTTIHGRKPPADVLHEDDEDAAMDEPLLEPEESGCGDERSTPVPPASHHQATIPADILYTDDKDAAEYETEPKVSGCDDEGGEPTLPTQSPASHHQAAIHNIKPPADVLHADDEEAMTDGPLPEPEESGYNEESDASASPTLPTPPPALHNRKPPADVLHADDEDATMDEPLSEPEESGCNEESGAPTPPTVPPASHHQADIHNKKPPADVLHSDDEDTAMGGPPSEPEGSGCNEESGAATPPPALQHQAAIHSKKSRADVLHTDEDAAKYEVSELKESGCDDERGEPTLPASNHQESIHNRKPPEPEGSSCNEESGEPASRTISTPLPVSHHQAATHGRKSPADFAHMDVEDAAMDEPLPEPEESGCDDDRGVPIHNRKPQADVLRMNDKDAAVYEPKESDCGDEHGEPKQPTMLTPPHEEMNGPPLEPKESGCNEESGAPTPPTSPISTPASHHQAAMHNRKPPVDVLPIDDEDAAIDEPLSDPEGSGCDDKRGASTPHTVSPTSDHQAVIHNRKPPADDEDSAMDEPLLEPEGSGCNEECSTPASPTLSTPPPASHHQTALRSKKPRVDGYTDVAMHEPPTPKGNGCDDERGEPTLLTPSSASHHQAAIQGKKPGVDIPHTDDEDAAMDKPPPKPKRSSFKDERGTHAPFAPPPPPPALHRSALRCRKRRATILHTDGEVATLDEPLPEPEGYGLNDKCGAPASPTPPTPPPTSHHRTALRCRKRRDTILHTDGADAAIDEPPPEPEGSSLKDKSGAPAPPIPPTPPPASHHRTTLRRRKSQATVLQTDGEDAAMDEPPPKLSGLKDKSGAAAPPSNSPHRTALRRRKSQATILHTDGEDAAMDEPPTEPKRSGLKNKRGVSASPTPSPASHHRIASRRRKSQASVLHTDGEDATMDEPPSEPKRSGLKNKRGVSASPTPSPASHHRIASRRRKSQATVLHTDGEDAAIDETPTEPKRSGLKNKRGVSVPPTPPPVSHHRTALRRRKSQSTVLYTDVEDAEIDEPPPEPKEYDLKNKRGLSAPPTPPPISHYRTALRRRKSQSSVLYTDAEDAEIDEPPPEPKGWGLKHKPASHHRTGLRRRKSLADFHTDDRDSSMDVSTPEPEGYGLKEKPGPASHHRTALRRRKSQATILHTDDESATMDEQQPEPKRSGLKNKRGAPAPPSPAPASHQRTALRRRKSRADFQTDDKDAAVDKLPTEPEASGFDDERGAPLFTSTPAPHHRTALRRRKSRAAILNTDSEDAAMDEPSPEPKGRSLKNKRGASAPSTPPLDSHHRTALRRRKSQATILHTDDEDAALDESPSEPIGGLKDKCRAPAPASHHRTTLRRRKSRADFHTDDTDAADKLPPEPEESGFDDKRGAHEPPTLLSASHHRTALRRRMSRANILPTDGEDVAKDDPPPPASHQRTAIRGKKPRVDVHTDEKDAVLGEPPPERSRSNDERGAPIPPTPHPASLQRAVTHSGKPQAILVPLIRPLQLDPKQTRVILNVDPSSSFALNPRSHPLKPTHKSTHKIKSTEPTNTVIKPTEDPTIRKIIQPGQAPKSAILVPLIRPLQLEPKQTGIIENVEPSSSVSLNLSNDSLKPIDKSTDEITSAEPTNTLQIPPSESPSIQNINDPDQVPKLVRKKFKMKIKIVARKKDARKKSIKL